MWIYILNKKIKHYTKAVLKCFYTSSIAFCFIIAIILIKYKPSYQVSISGEKIGYVQSKKTFEESIKQNLLVGKEKNIDAIDIKQFPKYELKLVNRTLKTNQEDIIHKIEKNVVITYKYYEIALNNKTIELVNTLKEAEELINMIDNSKERENLSIIEKYTQNEEDIKTVELDIAKQDMKQKLIQAIQEQKTQEQIDSMPSIQGIKLATKPISGTITSRYGVSSNIRQSSHTGLDIAAKTGAPIQVVADGTVISASYNKSYGNLVKISHGNGLETWYAHTSKMYVIAGQKVKAGETIAAVGTTGNSTGPHLHFEIRINGQHINPQNYLYN